MSDTYNNAWTVLNSVSDGDFIGDHLDELNTDQRLKVAGILALLSISEELSFLNPQNTTGRDKDGNTRNGWGMIVPR